MSKTAEILAIGTELLLGNIANTDAQAISQGLSELGINVFYHTVVGDNGGRIKQAIEIAKTRADILITTGGLGPTYDDISKETVAACFGKTLVSHAPTVERINAYFEKNNFKSPTENNYRQAMLPEGCTVLQNDWGSAPGCAFEADGMHVLMLPGPPRECVSMFRHCAMPYLRTLSDAVLVSRNIRIFGMGESAVEDKLFDLMTKYQNPTVAPYAKEGEVMLRVTAKAGSEAEAAAMVDPVVEEIRGILGDVVYGVDIESLEEALFALLREKGLTFAAAESCTGGMLSSRLTDLAGVSEVFLGSVVAYANAAKTRLLGVPEALIAKHGAVSEPVAKAMAEGVRERFGADIAVAITGVAGPAASEEKPVGTVFIAVASAEGTTVYHQREGAGRYRVRISSTNRALDFARRHILGLEAAR
ncbi:competence/damage-inducible protein A [Oscillospiraceae bacterium OttesenSCG-928-F05]|nr:competence/damage-inducible protein A [Oscillospiraceae bacterium OttesenSCG-928-F05]